MLNVLTLEPMNASTPRYGVHLRNRVEGLSSLVSGWMQMTG